MVGNAANQIYCELSRVFVVGFSFPYVDMCYIFNFITNKIHIIKLLTVYVSLSPNRMGAHYINHTTGVEQDLAIEKIYIHENYNAHPYRYDNDIALIKLKTPAMLDSRTNLACIPDDKVQFPAGTSCYITGWGHTQSGGVSSYTLQEAKVLCNAFTIQTICLKIIFLQ